MPSAIPPTLAAYIQECLALHSQTLVTSVLSTPSTWLCLRLVYAALHGIEDRTLDRSEPVSRDSRPVIFVSLLRPLSLWTEMGRKLVCLNFVFAIATINSQPAQFPHLMKLSSMRIRCKRSTDTKTGSRYPGSAQEQEDLIR